jgi:hypothetical protein
MATRKKWFSIQALFSGNPCSSSLQRVLGCVLSGYHTSLKPLGSLLVMPCEYDKTSVQCPLNSLIVP